MTFALNFVAMEPIDYTQYLILSLLVIAWCVLHSAMISISVTAYFKKRLGLNYRYYRLFFNITAFLTLIPVALFAYLIRTQAIFQWNGHLRLAQVLILGTAGWLFLLGGRQFDINQLLGIRQIREKTSRKAITDTGELDTSGVLGLTRHAWYLATMLLIWARQMDISAVIVNVILTFYLIIGTYLEEKKLVREFGDNYRNYQKQVSMLIPNKWLKQRILKLQGH